jgi:alpha-D-ribose 1-methylphosphonate 5-triphosphate synthase subunit PhnG
MAQPASADPGRRLSVLSRAPAHELKQFADDLIPYLGPIDVVRNRSGLVMLPLRDPVQGTTFYLGEVLVAEAQVRLGGAQGYAACLGRDVAQALAIALIDAAHSAGLARERIDGFVEQQAARLTKADDQLLRQVEATRVEMETFEWQLPS